MTEVTARTEQKAAEHLDTRRRVWAIVGASSGNLVEWFDFYVYSFCSLYFAHIFFTTSYLNDSACTVIDVYQLHLSLLPNEYIADFSWFL